MHQQTNKQLHDNHENTLHSTLANCVIPLEMAFEFNQIIKVIFKCLRCVPDLTTSIIGSWRVLQESYFVEAFPYYFMVFRLALFDAYLMVL